MIKSHTTIRFSQFKKIISKKEMTSSEHFVFLELALFQNKFKN